MQGKEYLTILIIQGASKNEREQLSLSDWEKLSLLASSSIPIDGINDEENFVALKKSMKVLGIQENTQVLVTPKTLTFSPS